MGVTGTAITLVEACRLALNGLTGFDIAGISDIGDRWVISTRPRDDVLIPGDCPIAIWKKDGKIDGYDVANPTQPDINVNGKRLDEGKVVPIPAEFVPNDDPF